LIPAASVSCNTNGKQFQFETILATISVGTARQHPCVVERRRQRHQNLFQFRRPTPWWKSDPPRSKMSASSFCRDLCDRDLHFEPSPAVVQTLRARETKIKRPCARATVSPSAMLFRKIVKHSSSTQHSWIADGTFSLVPGKSCRFFPMANERTIGGEGRERVTDAWPLRHNSRGRCLGQQPECQFPHDARECRAFSKIY